MKPIAEAPEADREQRVLLGRHPADLHEVPVGRDHAAAPRWRPRNAADGSGGVPGAHERLADQYRVVADGGAARRGRGVTIPDSATVTTSEGNRPASALGRVVSTSKVRRSRWLTPTTSAPSSSASVLLGARRGPRRGR